MPLVIPLGLHGLFYRELNCFNSAATVSRHILSNSLFIRSHSREEHLSALSSPSWLPLDGLPWNPILVILYEYRPRNCKFVRNRTKISDTLCKELNKFSCCRRNKFTTKALLCNTQYSHIVYSGL